MPPVLTPTFSDTPTTVPTAPPTSVDSGTNEVLDVVAWPNPNPRFLRVKLSGASDMIRVKVYTRAFHAAGEIEAAGAYQAGWNSVALPDLGGLPAGAYFAKVESVRQGVESLKTGACTLMLIK